MAASEDDSADRNRLRPSARQGSTGSEPPGITALLADWRQGDSRALDEIVSTTYDLLRRLANHVMVGERGDHTLQPTALVHEAWQRLSAGHKPALKDRRHFFNIAAKVMRRVLIDHARRRTAGRRDGTAGESEVVLEAGVTESDRIEVLALDSALRKLEEVDPRRVRVVELHCFAGLTLDETADALGVAQVTVCRDWRLARAYLARALSGEPNS